MTSPTININRKTIHFSQWQCHVIYVLLVSPFVYGIILLENKSRIFFHLLLFFTGWLTFTFLEYIAHRFWLHSKEKKHPGKRAGLHVHHHHHPAELRITPGIRNKLIIGNLLLIAAAFTIDNYFTAFTGFYTGFVCYCFMHVFLHKPCAKEIFPRLQVSHIHHHCKHPDKCFGISVPWWDYLFRTTAGRNAIVSERILSFYYNELPVKVNNEENI